MASTSAGADRIVERPGRSNSQDVAATKSDVKSILRTKMVLRNLLIMVPSFYMIVYSTSSIIHAIYRETFHVKDPFNFKECCLETAADKANGISIIVSFPLSSSLFLLVTTIRLWDHIVTVTLLHVILVILVMLEFPLNWQWWVALAIGFFGSILLGEITAYYLCQKISKRNAIKS